MPQTRDGFFPWVLERYQRSEGALMSALAEWYVQGVSTRKVGAICEELFGDRLSHETVSLTPQVSVAWVLFEKADALLVVGSSLSVYSGRRFIYRAERERVPIHIVNVGPTRADGVAAIKVEARLGVVLPRIADTLLGSEGGADS